MSFAEDRIAKRQGKGEAESEGAAAADIGHAMQNPVKLSLGILALLAVVYSLYFGRDLLLPIVIAAILNLLLRPAMRFLGDRCRLPLTLAAAILIVLVFAAIFSLALALSGPSNAWMQRLPESFALLKDKLAFLGQPITYLQAILHSIESIGSGPAPAVAVAGGSELPKLLLFGTASTLSQLFTTIVILYFMLAFSDRLLRALIEVLPTFRDKRRAVDIAGEIQSSVASYLATVTLMNLCVGALTAAAVWACGLPDAPLWGVVAFLLNFIPLVGPMICAVIILVAGLIALPLPLQALAPAGLYFFIHLVEGQVLTPMLLARRFELNPVLSILSLFFWHAIWGVPGALLAVPLLAVIKIVCDRVEPLKPVGHLIGA